MSEESVTLGDQFGAGPAEREASRRREAYPPLALSWEMNTNDGAAWLSAKIDNCSAAYFYGPWATFGFITQVSSSNFSEHWRRWYGQTWGCAEHV